MPNFDGIAQSTAEIKLLPVSENGEPPYWNRISGFDFDVCAASACHTLACHIS